MDSGQPGDSMRRDVYVMINIIIMSVYGSLAGERSLQI